MRVIQHVTIFATTVNRTLNKGCSVNNNFSLINICQIVQFGYFFFCGRTSSGKIQVYCSLSSTKDVTCIIGSACLGHYHIIRSYLTITDGHIAGSSSLVALVRFTNRYV